MPEQPFPTCASHAGAKADNEKPYRAWVLGASGYTGALLCRLLEQHPSITLTAAFSSGKASAKESANDSTKCPASDVNSELGPSLSDLYPRWSGISSLRIQAWQDSMLTQAAAANVVFLALPHEVSHRLAPCFIEQGCQVYDLSGAYRLQDVNKYPDHYGFTHQAPALLAKAHYALPELTRCEHAPADANGWHSALQSLPGCYPTAAALALSPLLQSGLVNAAQMPVVTAVSGVSGAGRKASLATSFCEVSLQPYAVLTHRHQAEIEQTLGCEVIFVPQLGNFKRGIVATAAVTLAEPASAELVGQLYQQAYSAHPAVRLRQQAPKVDDVVDTPFCDLYVQCVGRKVVVVAAIDNLLKGAASQAVQAFNLGHQRPVMEGLL